MEPRAELLFPTIIWKHEIKQNLDVMRRHVLALKDNDPGTNISNVGGWQSNSQDISKDFIDWQIALDKTIKQCCTQSGLPPLKLYNLWFNVNGKGHHNSIHNHHGAILSGVYYVHTPENCGSIEFYRDDDSEYYLPALESYNNFTKQKHVIDPAPGLLVIFPGWLKHSVQPNNNKDERISISFNYGVR
jgi:uncharacterized protein (TIGR02466 family)